MAVYIHGRESDILEEIRKGRKTIEARLAKPSFRAFKPGDRINIREDFWEDGKVVKSKMSGVITEVTKVELYPSFEEMFKHVDFRAVLPNAKNQQEALSTIYHFYNSEQEKRLGVVAIHFKLVK